MGRSNSLRFTLLLLVMLALPAGHSFAATSAWVPQPLVSFDFDDGNENAYQIGLPVINAAGYKATEYIITSRMTAPNFVSAAQVLEMQAKGNEVGAHTQHHIDLSLANDAVAKAEIEGSRLDLLNIGVRSVTAFAYPFGASTSSTPNIVQNAGFLLARLTAPGLNDPSVNPYMLRRFPLDASTTLPGAFAAIDQAVASKKWLILVMHHIDQNNSESISSTTLQQIVNYVKAKNIRVVTATEGYNLVYATSSPAAATSTVTATSSPITATSTVAATSSPTISTSTPAATTTPVISASSTPATTTPAVGVSISSPEISSSTAETATSSDMINQNDASSTTPAQNQTPSSAPPPAPPPTQSSGGGGGGLYVAPSPVPTAAATVGTTSLTATTTPAPITAGTVLGASTYNFTRFLHKGMSGDDVLELQKILEARGFLTIDAPTNYFGAMTEAGVKAFQKANGLEQVGSVGPKTLALLNSSESADTDRQALIDSLMKEVQILLAKIAALQSAQKTI